MRTRTGLIAQKIGMTRIFSADGQHVPVTVMKVDGCHVIAHRTEATNGYVALQLGVGAAKAKSQTKAQRGHFAKAKVEPRKKVAEFRVSSDAMVDVGLEITAAHFVEGQKVDVTGTSLGKGFAGAMKRWNFGGMRATTVCPCRTVPTVRRVSARIRARPSPTRRWQVTWVTSA